MKDRDVLRPCCNCEKDTPHARRFQGSISSLEEYSSFICLRCGAVDEGSRVQTRAPVIHGIFKKDGDLP